MNTYREMYEALLQGYILYSSGQEISMNKEGVITTNWFTDTVNIQELIPSLWSIKPKTININGFEVPEPVRKPLLKGDKYWVVNLQGVDGVLTLLWIDHERDYFMLYKGLIQRTEEAARLHAEALWSFTAKEGV